MRLDVAPQLAKMILDATSGSIECVSDRNGQIVGGLVVDGDVRAGHTEIDPHVERTSFTVMMNRRFYYDVASSESRKIELKVVGMFADLRLHSWGQLKIT